MRARSEARRGEEKRSEVSRVDLRALSSRRTGIYRGLYLAIIMVSNGEPYLTILTGMYGGLYLAIILVSFGKFY
jgi:hypothetical protein